MIRLSSSSLLLLKSSSSVSIPSSSISSISKSLSPSISILSLYVPCIYQQYRYAGGGGRPGGKPTFNWKQRKLLGLDELKDQKDMRVKFAGDFNDLKPFMDITRGDFIKEAEKMEDGIIFDFNNDNKNENRKKKINIQALFGPEKTSGIILKKQNYHQRKFSHKRIFGHKGTQSVDQ